MSLAFRFVLIALVLVLSACERPVVGERSRNPDAIHVGTPEEADRVFREFTVECEDVPGCHPSVALLIAKESAESLTVCTASLVTGDIVFTNKHCLPPELMSAGSDCRGQVLIKFPETPEYRAETHDCENVEIVSPYNVLREPRQQTDFAFLRLATKTNRPRLVLDTRGIDDGEILKVIRMTPILEHMKGVISDVKCRAVQNTVVTPLFKSRLSPVVHVNDCPIVKGNSGAPLLGANGRVKGIIQQGKGDPSKAPLISKTFARGTNVACIEFPRIGLFGARAEECEQELSDETEMAALEELWQKQIRFEERAIEIEKRANEHARSAPPFLQWRLESELRPFEDDGYETLAGGVLMSVRLDPECASLRATADDGLGMTDRARVRLGNRRDGSRTWRETGRRGSGGTRRGEGVPNRQGARADSNAAGGAASGGAARGERMSESDSDGRNTKFRLVEWVVRWEIDDDLRFRSRIEEKVIEAEVEFSPLALTVVGEGEIIIRTMNEEGITLQTSRLSVCPVEAEQEDEDASEHGVSQAAEGVSNRADVRD